jgi:hypothetical protein
MPKDTLGSENVKESFGGLAVIAAFGFAIYSAAHDRYQEAAPAIGVHLRHPKMPSTPLAASTSPGSATDQTYNP